MFLVNTFHSDVQFRRIIYRGASNWTWKLSANSNGHNFWLGCMLEAHHISRRSKMNYRSSQKIQIVITFNSDVQFRRIIYRDAQNWTPKLLANSNSHNFWLGCMLEAHDISRCLKMKNRSSLVIRLVIIFHSDVRFRRIIYRDARNWTRKLSVNSNGHNFWLGCMREAHYISRRSKIVEAKLPRLFWWCQRFLRRYIQTRLKKSRRFKWS